MTFREWEQLSEPEQTSFCQELSPYEEWAVFKGVEAEFRGRFGSQLGVISVFCGLGSGLGPYNCISVKIKRGAVRTPLPKRFMGFPVERSY